MRKTKSLLILALCLFILTVATGCGELAPYVGQGPDNVDLPTLTPPQDKESQTSSTSSDALPTPASPLGNSDGVIPVIPTTQAPTVASYVRSKVNSLNIRSVAGAYSASLGHIDKDDMVLYLGKEGDWYKTYYRGKKAYLSALSAYTEIVTIECGDEVTEKVIAVGAKLLGTPYVYGATRLHDGKGNLLKGFSDEQFDCSSFTQYIYYYGAGIILDVTTRTQAVQGADVPISELRRGDLMYFTNASRSGNVGIERIGHVAIYLGDGYLLHTASDYAVIERLTAARRAYLICIRRHI